MLSHNNYFTKELQQFKTKFHLFKKHCYYKTILAAFGIHYLSF